MILHRTPTHRYIALPAGRTKREPVEEARRALFWLAIASCAVAFWIVAYVAVVYL